MRGQTLLEIIAQGAWNGGTDVDNSIFENKGMAFKGNIPVNHQTIEQRIGVRKRRVAPPGVKISILAMEDLLDSARIDPSRIRLVIGATNIGEDKYDPGPVVRHAFEVIRPYCPSATVLDLYAGCPGFNLSVELAFVLSLTGQLKEGDLTVIVGAEAIYRSNTFKPLDTSNLLFGDDALTTALETKDCRRPSEGRLSRERIAFSVRDDFVNDIAERIHELNGMNRIDGIIVDNQLGKAHYRIPATAARVQHRLVELLYPEEAAAGTFKKFKEALEFYDRYVNSFAFDIMTMEKDPSLVERIAQGYVESGKYPSIASVYLSPDRQAEITLLKGTGYLFERPRYGIVDTHTRTHGCFADYIHAYPEGEDVFAKIDGKGVFLHATHSARNHLTEFLSKNDLTLHDIDLLVEHQANFAMIPMTLERLFSNGEMDPKGTVRDYLANRMITNIHYRGNCSVVCMQRLPYDLERGVLKEDVVQGFTVNRNVENLRHARVILHDSVGSGMTRSSFLQRRRDGGRFPSFAPSSP